MPPGSKNTPSVGGHAEFGESIEKALVRELKEETSANVKKSHFLGIIENKFGKGKNKHHEINFIYKAALKSYDIKNIEDHIEFYWKDIAVFKQTSFLPLQLKKQLRSWMKRNLSPHLRVMPEGVGIYFERGSCKIKS